MHLCLRNRADRIPSPYRLFDCTGKRCNDELGVSLDEVSAIMHQGVSDIDSSPQQFGLPCSEDKETIQFQASHGLVMSVAETKAALLLTNLPLLGVTAVQLLQEHDTGIFRAGPPKTTSHALVAE